MASVVLIREVFPSWYLITASIGMRLRPGVHPFDHVPVPLSHERAADLPRAGQFVVVRIQFLVQEQEPPDPRRFGKRVVDLLHFLREQLQDLGLPARSV